MHECCTHTHELFAPCPAVPRLSASVAPVYGCAGVSVGYFDTEDAAARAYDRAAIGLLGRQNCKAVLNFPIEEYDNDSVPELVGECDPLLFRWVLGCAGAAAQPAC